MLRSRNYRIDKKTRDKYAEVKLSARDLIYPYFVVEGEGVRESIPSMEGVYQLSIDALIDDINEAYSYGIDKFLLFGVVDSSLKDDKGSSAWMENNIVSKAVREVKKRFPMLTIMTDVCVCGYTSHGHCGVLNADDQVDNDATIKNLARIAVSHAEAGADFVAPSAMMDGQVEAIRKELDKRGLIGTKILSYSAKYHSAFYGPFRDAVESAPAFGDRKTYQMDYRTIGQSIEEVEADIAEGADWLMVKPAHTYLDIIYMIKNKFPDKTLVGYHVSGEYAMIKAAAAKGYIDENEAMVEALTAIKRAGADHIISYFAKEYMSNLSKKD